MKVNTGYLLLKTDKKVSETTTQIRGYVGRQFQNKLLLHNHQNEELVYSYPLVQYKKIGEDIIIFAMEEGLDSIKEIMSQLKELKMKNTYKITEKMLYEKEYEIKESKQLLQYKIITPWLALNQKNYKKYTTLINQKEKKIFLNKILIGNILSMSKSFGIMVNEKLLVKSHLQIQDVNYKSVVLKGFTGEFQTNFQLPDYIGLGKGVSHGYGTIVNTKLDE